LKGRLTERAAEDLVVAHVCDGPGRAAVLQEHEAPAHHYGFALAIGYPSHDWRNVARKDCRQRLERGRSVVGDAKKAAISY
jgi:hypothetical protein